MLHIDAVTHDASSALSLVFEILRCSMLAMESVDSAVAETQPAVMLNVMSERITNRWEFNYHQNEAPKFMLSFGLVTTFYVGAGSVVVYHNSIAYPTL